MIRNSFIFLPKVGEQKEKKLWQSGIRHWNEFLETKTINGITNSQKEMHDAHINVAMKHLREDNAQHFSELLPNSQHWRLWNQFKEDAVFLDIETTGFRGKTTVVGLYDGKDTKLMVRHINLDIDILKKELSKYKLLLTFNGRCFDMPVLRKEFGIDLKIPHIDLRYACANIGLRGGLKKIEQAIGIQRPGEVAEVDGFEAVRLYRKWRRTGESEYLDLLCKYNEEDIINLKTLANFTIPKLWTQTFE